jgi:hypothetical protein
MEGVIVLGTAGIALISGLVGLVFGTVQRLRPLVRKKRPQSPRSSRETLQPLLALEARHLVPVVDGQGHFRASPERSSPRPRREWAQKDHDLGSGKSLLLGHARPGVLGIQAIGHNRGATIC